MGWGGDYDNNKLIRLVSFNPISSRICRLTLNLGYKKVHLFNIYAPHNDSVFNMELENVLKELPHRDGIILAGDFNASVGKSKNSSCLGNATLIQSTNPNGKRQNSLTTIKYIARKDLAQLNDLEVKEEFVSKLTSWRNTVNSMINPNLTWKDIKLNLLGSITSCLRPRTKRREWLTPPTIQIIKNLTTNISHHQFAKHHRRYITHRIRADKRLFIANLSNSIQFNFDNNNIYKAFQSLKLLTTFKTNPLPRLQLNNNKIITDPKEQLDLWIDHYMNLYRTRWPRPRCDYPFQTPSQNLNKSDIVGAIKRLKMHKAAGADGIFAELWKIEVNLSASLLLPLFREIWNTGKFPDEWMTSIILNFPKNKSPNCLKDYRGIALIPVTLKMFTYIISVRIKPIINRFLSNAITSYRKGRNTTELTMALKVILEKARMHKSPIFALI
ncbi:uncharacterized protein LOC135924099 [Gordionus sp. m RMFG-2023]|uniref:uncharacterized protein LOC135924099 n=1 Tax=Gordionus sp. m RMFG-2023 TaxID=3053472 RepID=UPI0031FD6B35